MPSRSPARVGPNGAATSSSAHSGPRAVDGEALGEALLELVEHLLELAPAAGLDVALHQLAERVPHVRRGG